jgi:uncharacterized membrane protein
LGFLIFLFVVTWIFSFVGVIVLLSKTAGQSERIDNLESRAGRLNAEIEELRRMLKSAPAAGTKTAPYAGEPYAGSAGLAVNPPPEITASTETAALSGETRPQAEQLPPDTAPEIPGVTHQASEGYHFVLAEPVQIEKGAPPALWTSVSTFVHGGNLWAAGGIVLLIAGFATLITYLARRGFFTVEMGIAAAALCGLVMLVLGLRFRQKRPVFFLLLQGGGIGILYLSVFAANKLTAYFSVPVSLVLMSLLVIPAVILALFQRSQVLAIFAFLGGFGAPLLLSTGSGSHVFLFSYFMVLNLGVLGIGFFRQWKGLNLLALLFTFVTALYWTANSYQPSFFWSAEPFFLGFMAIFTILGIYGLGNQNQKQRYYDGILILLTPVLGAFLQWKIFSYIEHGYPIASILFSAFYLALALVIWKRMGRAALLYSEVYLYLAVFLANLAVPLELSPRITSAVWAAEGALFFLLGLRLSNFRVTLAALILHAAAAIAFAFEAPGSAGDFRSPRFIGSLVIALSAFVMIVIAEKNKKGETNETAAFTIDRLYPAFPFVTALWAFSFWFGGWFYEFNRVVVPHWEAFFIFCSATALVSCAAARILRCPPLTLGGIPSLVFGFCLLMGSLGAGISGYGFWPGSIFTHNFFRGLYLWGWLAFFAGQGVFLFFTRKQIREGIHGVWLLAFILISLGVLSSSGRALAILKNFAESWKSFLGLLPSFAVIIGASFWPGRNSTNLPVPEGGAAESGGKDHLRSFLVFFILPLILFCIMGIWFLVTVFLPGNPDPLPFYIPIVNPLDLEEAFCIVLFLLWQNSLRRTPFPALGKVPLTVLTDIAVFIFAIAVTARSVSFYGKIRWDDITASDIFHLCLFILWAVYGIAHIIAGSKLAERRVWLAGAILTVADIAKLLIFDLAGTGAVTRIISFFAAGILLIFIGWIAPLPPAAGKPPAEDSGDSHE